MHYLVYTPSLDRASDSIPTLQQARILAVQYASRGDTVIYCLDDTGGALPECVGEITVEKTGMGFAFEAKGRTK